MSQLPLYGFELIDGSLNLVNYTQEVIVPTPNLFTGEIATTFQTEEERDAIEATAEKQVKSIDAIDDDFEEEKQQTKTKTSFKSPDNSNRKFIKQNKEFYRKQL